MSKYYLLQDSERCIGCLACEVHCKTNKGLSIGPALCKNTWVGPVEVKGLPRVRFVFMPCFHCEEPWCFKVCPSGAIRSLAVEEKHRTVIGTVWFDRDRCLPYAKGIPCLVCEEHCPVPEKAIRLRETEVGDPAGRKVKVKVPYVVDRLCIGCGICENKCPLPGRAAVITTLGFGRS